MSPNAMPTVSVLMTAYNREGYVASAIESVLAQRFTDFELIVVDDRSADGTVEVARRYAARDRRVRVEVNERNLGDYGNRNRAASLARGRYLKYHDSDDLMYPHCLQTMVPLLDAAPTAGLAMSASAAWPGGPVPMLLSTREAFRREFLGPGLFMGGPACGLIRAETFQALGGFEEVGAHADYLFWMRACSRYSVLLVPSDLFWYRIHAGQELASPRAASDYARMNRAVWAMLASAACPLVAEERAAARRSQAWTVARQTWRDLRAFELNSVLYRLRHAGMTAGDWVRYLRRPNRQRLVGTPLDGEDYVMPDWVRLPAPSPRS